MVNNNSERSVTVVWINWSMCVPKIAKCRVKHLEITNVDQMWGMKKFILENTDSGKDWMVMPGNELNKSF